VPESAAAPSAPQAPAEPAPQPSPEPSQPEAPGAEDAPEAPDADDTNERVAVGRAPGDLSQLAPEIRTNRLPAVGAGAAPEQEAAAAPADSLPPIRRYAAEVDLPPDSPRLAIVLVDDGTLEFGAEALAGFPFPVSVALDPARPDAAEAMAAYRAKGIEVLAMADLPEGAAPQDAEVASGVWFDVLPETVAVLEGRPGALQQDRALAEQVAGILAESGRGLVLHAQGLNTGLALAERAEVPAATLFRSLGGAGEDAGAMQRALEQASLRARSEGAALVTAPLRAEVLPVLVSWGVGNRDAGLALAPASAVLLTGHAAE
jgi:hypothetical protein